ncbi:MAG: PssE/Cps14G family polysaccharide biosynthesis glycosyltransferase [Methanobacteriota archaeon]
MIFVTISKGAFDRLIKSVDSLAERIDEDIVMQIGNTRHIPRNTQFFRFCSKKEMDDYYKKADLIITHGGAGSLFSALRFSKKCIAVPRYREFGEHVDDHQLQIVRELAKEKRVIAVYDVNELEEAISKARNFKPELNRDSSLVDHIKSIIDS